MKKLLYLSFILLFITCKSEQSSKVQRYTGTLTFTNKNFVDGKWTTPQVLTIEDFELELDDGIFRRRLSKNSKFEKYGEACSGTYSIINQRFSAWGDGCPCWCDCDPEIDCAGDFILGDYDVLEMSSERLLLSKITIRKYEYDKERERRNEILIDLKGVQ